MTSEIKLKVGEYFTNKNEDFVVKIKKEVRACMCGKCDDKKILGYECIVVKGTAKMGKHTYSIGEEFNTTPDGIYFFTDAFNEICSPPFSTANLTHEFNGKIDEVKAKPKNSLEAMKEVNDMINNFINLLEKNSSQANSRIKLEVGKQYKEADNDKWNIIFHRKDKNFYLGILNKGDGYQTLWFTQSGHSIGTSKTCILIEEVNG